MQIFAFFDSCTIEFFIFVRIFMKELEDRILKDGILLDKDIIKIGSFLNQQVDTELLINDTNAIIDKTTNTAINIGLLVKRFLIKRLSSLAMK